MVLRKVALSDLSFLGFSIEFLLAFKYATKKFRDGAICGSNNFLARLVFMVVFLEVE